jgi:peptidyl-prolyl cis-trans isomerase A (cyclophilin A)
MSMKTLVLALVVLAVAAPAVAFAEEAKSVKAEAKKLIVDIETSKGTITVELWPDKAPNTVKNFVGYVIGGHYDGTIFHRVIKGFMIQGGGYTETLEEKPTGPPIKLEAKESNRRYTIAMARTNDPNSATSQFYINLVDNTGLDPEVRPPGYTVFGKVIKGTSVVDQIANLPKTSKPPIFTDLTTPVVVIKSAKLVD